MSLLNNMKYTTAQIKAIVKGWTIWSDWKALQLSIEVNTSINIIRTYYLQSHN